MIKGLQLFDRIKVPSKRTLTDAGQMHVPCTFARTGTQLYTAKQLGLVDRSEGEVITVHREQQDVFDSDSMDTFRSAPVTLGHPKEKDGSPKALTADNAKELQVGMLEGMPIRNEDTLGGVLIITAQEAIDALEDGTQELSAGYLCDIEELDGKFYQRNIRANHIAIVPRGRAGSSCRISDEALELEDKVLLVKHAVLGDEVVEAKLLVDSLKLELVSVKEKAEEDKKVLEDDLAKEILDHETSKVSLKEAKLAAEEGVVERCDAIENARLVADMRDLGSKTVAEIKLLVVEDQMPDRDFSEKGEPYIAAMFDLLVDSAKGETPMGKLIKQQEAHVTVDAKPENKVEAARERSIQRSRKG